MLTEENVHTMCSYTFILHFQMSFLRVPPYMLGYRSLFARDEIYTLPVLQNSQRFCCYDFSALSNNTLRLTLLAFAYFSLFFLLSSAFFIPLSWHTSCTEGQTTGLSGNKKKKKKMQIRLADQLNVIHDTAVTSLIRPLLAELGFSPSSLGYFKEKAPIVATIKMSG